MPESFAATCVSACPRNVLPTEVREVWRAARVLRPLWLKNMDAKLVHHSLNAPLSRHIARHAHGAPRGFVRGRNLLANVIEVDAEAMIQAMRGDAHTLLVLICFDFVAAFPSAAHEFLRRAMVETGLPYGLIAIVVEIYRTVALHIARDAGLQLSRREPCMGSHLSSSFFVLVMDMLVAALDVVVPAGDWVARDCVDEIVAPVFGEIGSPELESPWTWVSWSRCLGRWRRRAAWPCTRSRAWMSRCSMVRAAGCGDKLRETFGGTCLGRVAESRRTRSTSATGLGHALGRCSGGTAVSRDRHGGHADPGCYERVSSASPPCALVSGAAGRGAEPHRGG